MSGYLGDFLPGKTVRARFNTVNTSGVPTTLTSGAAIISKDGADVTPSGGVTLATDAGGVTGRHHVVIDTSVDATTFTAGSEYAVRLSGSSAVAGTSVVGILIGEFSLANRSVAVDSAGKTLLQPTQAGVTIPTVTTLTNLPAITTDWLTAAGVKADAVTKIQSGLATPTNITAGTITTATNLTNLPAITTDWLSAAGVSAAAVTKIQAGLATPTNITAGTITAATNLTNLPAIPANWITAAGIAAAALNGKGDWLTPGGYTVPPTAAAIATAVLTTAMAESYNADGAAPTLAQAQFVVMQRLTDFAIASTSITVKKLDGLTTAYTLTMDSPTAPASSTRSS